MKAKKLAPIPMESILNSRCNIRDEMTVGVYDEAREKLCDERGLSEDDIDAVLEYAEIFCPMNALVRTITPVVWEED